MVKILDGRVVRDNLAQNLKEKIARLKAKPKLAIIQVGNLAESTAYIKQKKAFGVSIGASVEHLQFESTVEEKDLLLKIASLNQDKSVHGIIIQLPLPENLNRGKLIEAIAPEKDVDGLTSRNVKALEAGNSSGLIPATAKGIMTLLDYYKIPVLGKRVVVVGRSNLVGKPTALALLNRGATVTVAHSQTPNLPQVTKLAEILIVAIGKPKFINAEYVSKGQVVIDVGINAPKKLDEEIPGKKLVGDVDFESVSKIVSAISPVPGGVGPMTVVSLFENLILAYIQGSTLDRKKGRTLDVP